MSDKEQPRICVLLLQLGGPETIDDIEPFLKNLLYDVLPLPPLFRRFVAHAIAKARASKVAPLYEEIGGGSPLRRQTEEQAAALEEM